MSNVKFEDSVISFTRHIEFNENSIDFTYSATIDGDSIKGAMASERFGDRPFEGKRVGSGSSSNSSSSVSERHALAVGNWKFSIATPGGPREIKLKLAEADGELTGTWTGPGGEIPIENAYPYDGDLRFDINIESPIGSFTLTYEARLFKNSFYGQFITTKTRGTKTR